MDHPAGIPRPLFENFERCFVDLTRHKNSLWAELGLHTRLPAYGLLGLATLTAPTVRHVLKLTEEFWGIPFSRARLGSVVIDGQDGVCFDLSMVPADLSDFTLVRDIAAAIAVKNDLWTGVFPFTQLRIPSSRVGLLPLLRRFAIPVAVGDGEPCLLWRQEHSRRQLFNGDAQLHEYYVRECRKLLISELFAEPFLERVSRVIETKLAVLPHEISLEHAAKALSISVRTLQRRLNQRGISFRDICDATRRKLAEGYLDDPAVSVADIAFRLGYSEPAGFHHAFKRWLGQGPNEFRRERRLIATQ
jgi:AraC-like DNA-binding protein